MVDIRIPGPGEDTEETPPVAEEGTETGGSEEDKDDFVPPLPVGRASSGGRGIALNKIWANVKTPLLVLALCWTSVAPFVAGSGGNDDNDSSRLQAIDSTTQRIAAEVQAGNAVANATNKVVNRIDTTTTNTWYRVDCALKCPPEGRTTSGGTRRRVPAPATPRDTVPATPQDTTRCDTVIVREISRDTVYIESPCPQQDTVQKPKQPKAEVHCYSIPLLLSDPRGRGK